MYPGKQIRSGELKPAWRGGRGQSQDAENKASAAAYMPSEEIATWKKALEEACGMCCQEDAEKKLGVGRVTALKLRATPCKWYRTQFLWSAPQGRYWNMFREWFKHQKENLAAGWAWSEPPPPESLNFVVAVGGEAAKQEMGGQELTVLVFKIRMWTVEGGEFATGDLLHVASLDNVLLPQASGLMFLHKPNS